MTVRIAPEDRALFEAAAKREGESFAEFLLTSGRLRAEGLADRTTFAVESAHHAAIMAVLERPPAVRQELVDLFRHARPTLAPRSRACGQHRTSGIGQGRRLIAFAEPAIEGLFEIRKPDQSDAQLATEVEPASVRWRPAERDECSNWTTGCRDQASVPEDLTQAETQLALNVPRSDALHLSDHHRSVRLLPREIEIRLPGRGERLPPLLPDHLGQRVLCGVVRPRRAITLVWIDLERLGCGCLNLLVCRPVLAANGCRRNRSEDDARPLRLRLGVKSPRARKSLGSNQTSGTRLAIAPAPTREREVMTSRNDSGT